MDFLDRLAIKSKLETTNPAAKKRFFVKYGKPQAVPMGPLSLLTTPLFSFFGKLRLLCEPFVKPLDAEDPSMAEFILHRFGKDVLDYAIDPFMGGIYGGSPEKLSAKYAFPAVLEFGEKIRLDNTRGNQVHEGKERGRGNFFKPMTISFEGGMETLAKGLADNLGDSLKCGAKALSIDFGGNGWQVEWVAGDDEICDNYDALVIAVPAAEIRNLPTAGSLAAALAPLDRIEYAPVATYTMGFPKDAVKNRLDGLRARLRRRRKNCTF